MALRGHSQYRYDEFSSLGTGAPSGWDAGASDDAWSVVSISPGPEPTNGNLLACVGDNDTGGNPLKWCVLSSQPFSDTTEVLIRCQTNVDDEFGSVMGVSVRAQAVPPAPGVLMYQAAFAHDIIGPGSSIKSLSLLRIGPPGMSAYERILLSADPFEWNPGLWYWIRFRAAGKVLSTRAWADGDPEPTSWQVTALDDSIAQGPAGVFTEYEDPGSRQVFDFISIASEGATAPAFLGEVASEIPTAEQFFSHSILDDPNIYPAVISPVGGIQAPALAYPVGPTEFIPSAETIFEHGIHDDVDTLLASLIPSAEDVYTPTTVAHATAELIDDSEVYAPRIKRDWTKPPVKSARDEPVEHWQHEPLTNRPPRNQS